MFDSSAILLYLGDKTGRFIGAPADRPELLSWLFFIATGLGPFSGQAVHFQHAAPEKLAYAVNRYRREVERHYRVLDEHLAGRRLHRRRRLHDRRHVGLGLARRAPRGCCPARTIRSPPSRISSACSRRSTRGRRSPGREAVGKDHPFKKEVDEEAKRAMFPSNYPEIAM